jgi:hypothetical protein
MRAVFGGHAESGRQAFDALMAQANQADAHNGVPMHQLRPKWRREQPVYHRWVGAKIEENASVNQAGKRWRMHGVKGKRSL